MELFKDKYCVYLHKANGVVFYIGMGICSRPFYLQQRNYRWNQVFESTSSFEVEILDWYENMKDAYTREAKEIKERQPSANKHHKSETKFKLAHRRGRKGGFVRWAKISNEKRSEIMRKVAQARYGKKN